MTKHDYLNELNSELTKNAVTDAEDILMEYEQHFQFKLADGFSEDEIALKLGSPTQIAAQYVGIPGEKKAKGGKKFFLVFWLTIIGIFEALLYGAFLCFVVALFVASLVPAALGVELIAGLNYLNILPPMPYGGAIVFGVMLLALSVILVVFAIYCFAYLRQMVRASLRWRKNLMRGDSLPMLPMSPQFQPKTRRVLRTLLLWAVLVFAIAFVAGFAILSIYTHSFGFWHALGWFGYPATIH
jgi:uncharacterized membrane protein